MYKKKSLVSEAENNDFQSFPSYKGKKKRCRGESALRSAPVYDKRISISEERPLHNVWYVRYE